MMRDSFFALLGILATILVGAWFYVRATRELREESKRLRETNTLILRALEQVGAKLSRNEQGEITGLTFDEKFTSGVGLGSSQKTD